MLGRLVSVGGNAVRVRRLGGNRAGEMRITRFLRNGAVTAGEMVAAAAARTAERCLGREVVVIQDTTAVRPESGGGGYLHGVIALDAADGALLGLVDASLLERGSGRAATRRDRPVEEKESFRWLEGAEAAASVCAGASRITLLADREGDIYEAFALRPERVDLVVRAGQDRSLDEGGSLFAALDAMPVVAHAALDLPPQPGRRARTARLALRFASVTLSRPRRSFSAGLPETLAIRIIDVREVDAPPGSSPVHWRLLTSRAVDGVEDAWAIIGLYRQRWAIEQLFRTMKTKGFDIEGLRIRDADPRHKLVIATLIAAVAIQQLVHGRDGQLSGPPRPCTDTFEAEDMPLLDAWCAKLEGKTARQKNPHPKASLAWAAWICARLGGWTGYYGKPGPIVMLEGWLLFQNAKCSIQTLELKLNV